MTTTTYGYSARLLPEVMATKRQWPKGDRFLIRDGIYVPLCSDPAVWFEALTEEGEALVEGLDVRCNWAWDTKADLVRFAREHPGAVIEPFVLLRLGVLADDDYRRSQRHPYFCGPHIIVAGAPNECVTAGGDFLGYDVSDSCYSALGNFYWHPEEHRQLCENWGPLLNEHHLFREVANAIAFREHVKTLETNHDPFHVVSLHVEDWCCKLNT